MKQVFGFRSCLSWAAAKRPPSNKGSPSRLDRGSSLGGRTKLCYYSTIVSNVRVGTSGWHYPTGRGRWDGVFYPARRGRGTTFDELAYYAAHFDTVEVNSTFYGQPRAEVTRGWAERTPAGFEFSVKLYQKFTHPEMFKGRLRRAAGVTPDRNGARAVASGDGARTRAR